MIKKMMCFCVLMLIIPAFVWGEFLDSGDTVTDTSTGLMWQKATHTVKQNWEGAMLACEALSFGGFSDWRLPSKAELMSIVDYTKYDPAVDSKFTTEKDYYWTSTTYAKADEGAATFSKSWCINFKDGMVEGMPKADIFYVRAVRGGQPKVTGNLYVSMPAQSSTWSVGQFLPISWDTAATDAKVYISREGGKDGTYVEISGEMPNSFSLVWTVTGPASDNCMLKIETGTGAKAKTITRVCFPLKREAPAAVMICRALLKVCKF
jgi:hypothetical protein